MYNLRTGRCLLRTRMMHGQGSGGRLARTFSNRKGNQRTALGRYVILHAYTGDFGRAYRLTGLDATNDNALSRSIVLHSTTQTLTVAVERPAGAQVVDTLREALRDRRQALKTEARQLHQDWQETESLRTRKDQSSSG